jgi:soluble lytic murein transglycosylase
MSKQAVAISLKKKALLASCFVAAALQPVISLAQTCCPSDIPTPLARPFAPTTTHQSP